MCSACTCNVHKEMTVEIDAGRLVPAVINEQLQVQGQPQWMLQKKNLDWGKRFLIFLISLSVFLLLFGGGGGGACVFPLGFH